MDRKELSIKKDYLSAGTYFEAQLFDNGAFYSLSGIVEEKRIFENGRAINILKKRGKILMKKFVKYTVAILLALIMSGMTVYAGPQFTSVDDFSYILPPEVKKSTAHENSVLRGEFFASAELTITNEKGRNWGYSINVL